MSEAMQWRRLDISGSETVLLEETASGWLLTGYAVFLYENKPCGFRYTVKCAKDWRTLSADISGHLGTNKKDCQIRVRENSWSMNGENHPKIQGCIDIDIGFSPATNLLPIRRLNLAEGESASIKTAWFQFPKMELIPLAQTYTRESSNKYRYESPANDFVCTIETNQTGFVTNYPGFWSSEKAT